MSSLKIERVATTSCTSQWHQYTAPAGNEPTSELPVGFPQILDSRMGWTGHLFPEPDSYVAMLTSEDLAELDVALVHFKCE